MQGLPAVFDIVPDDIVGFTMLDTDPESARWTALDGVLGDDGSDRVLDEWHASVFGDAVGFVGPDAWIGSVAGHVLRVADVDVDDGSDRFAYADVRDGSRLEAALREAGWTASSASELVVGTDSRLDVWIAPDAAGSDLPALAIGRGGLLAATSLDALRRVARVGATTTVADRKGLAVRVVDATQATPFAVVARTDVARAQTRRLFQHDPASLELTRWLFAAPFLNAVRDGWVGVAPPLDRSRRALRVVGSATWAENLSPDFLPTAVERSVLEELPADTQTAFAFHDPGAYAQTVVRSISANGIDFATKLDVPDGDTRIELLPLLDRLDGDAAFGLGPRGAVSARLDAGGDEDLADDVDDALELASVRADVASEAGRVVIRAGADRSRAGAASSSTLGDRSGFAEAIAGAGEPGRAPIAWLWRDGAGACDGPAAGWLTWDEAATFDFSIDVALVGGATCDPVDALTRLVKP